MTSANLPGPDPGDRTASRDTRESPPGLALVVGAGGRTGGAFIDAALAELGSRVGLDPSRARILVGTSAGAFTVAGTAAPTPGPRPDPQPGHAAGDGDVARLADGAWHPRWWDRPVAAARRRLGLLVAPLAIGRGAPVTWSVPDGPHHPEARVVTVHARSRRREVHRLAWVDDPAAVVRASAAIPFALRPVRLGGDPHVDGALGSSTNADLATPEGAGTVVVICALVPRSGGSLLSALDRAALRHELRPWVRAGRPVVVVAPTAGDHAARTDRDRFAEAGRDAVRRLDRATRVTGPRDRRSP